MKLHVVSKGIFHPTIFCRLALRKTLSVYPGVVFSNRMDSIDGIGNDDTDAVLLYFHEKLIGEGTLSSLVRFVEKGGLLLCLHGALASFKDIPVYNELTGSRFTGHGKTREINAKGIMDLSVIDEPYEFELSEDCSLLLSEGNLPVCWIRKHGLGKVAGLAPGHKFNTMRNPDFKNMIQYILNEYS